MRHGIRKQHQKIGTSHILQTPAHFRIYLRLAFIPLAKLSLFSDHTFISTDNYYTHISFVSLIHLTYAPK